MNARRTSVMALQAFRVLSVGEFGAKELPSLLQRKIMLFIGSALEPGGSHFASLLAHKFVHK